MIDFEAARDGARLDVALQGLPDVALDDETRGRLLRFAELVSQWGRKTDLVAASSVDQLLEVLFVDAFVAHAHVPAGGQWLDVGAGAGAPGIPLALLAPERRVRLRELRRRRLAFMRHAAGTLGLLGRVEVEPAKERDPIPGGCDVVLSRATFAPEEWLRVAEGLGARCLVLLRDQAPPEHPAWALAEVHEYALPSGSPRRLAVYDAV